MTTKIKSSQYNQVIQHALASLFLMERHKYTRGTIRFLSKHGMQKEYNVKLFSTIVAVPEMHEYLDRYHIKNHSDLHKYVQRRLIEYVNFYIAAGKK